MVHRAAFVDGLLAARIHDCAVGYAALPDKLLAARHDDGARRDRVIPANLLGDMIVNDGDADGCAAIFDGLHAVAKCPRFFFHVVDRDPFQRAARHRAGDCILTSDDAAGLDGLGAARRYGRIQHRAARRYGLGRPRANLRRNRHAAVGDGHRRLVAADGHKRAAADEAAALDDDLAAAQDIRTAERSVQRAAALDGRIERRAAGDDFLHAAALDGRKLCRAAGLDGLRAAVGDRDIFRLAAVDDLRANVVDGGAGGHAAFFNGLRAAGYGFVIARMIRIHRRYVRLCRAVKRTGEDIGEALGLPAVGADVPRHVDIGQRDRRGHVQQIDDGNRRRQFLTEGLFSCLFHEIQ